MAINNACVNSCRKQVTATKAEAEKDGVVVPMTLEDYCIKTQVKPQQESAVDMTDFYDDDYDMDDDDGDFSDNGEEYEDDDDSGNGES
jgi:ubiquitin-conjugating enzyme E2 R